MERAVQGESNTVLLLSAPGSSKSVIVETALEKLRNEYKDPGGFYTIRLDGEVQMDDKIALREIARQLALEMNVEMEKVIPYHIFNLTSLFCERCPLLRHIHTSVTLRYSW